MEWDHVAVLVDDLEQAMGRVQQAGWPLDDPEEFAAEGTREVYAGDPEGCARLLLIQPIDDQGPYARALARRGPGLHHLGITTPNTQRVLAEARGWLLHRRSLVTWAKTGTLWLARPGLGLLIELQQGETPSGPRCVERLRVRSDDPRAEAWLAPFSVGAGSLGVGEEVVGPFGEGTLTP